VSRTPRTLQTRRCKTNRIRPNNAKTFDGFLTLRTVLDFGLLFSVPSPLNRLRRVFFRFVLLLQRRVVFTRAKLLVTTLTNTKDQLRDALIYGHASVAQTKMGRTMVRPKRKTYRKRRIIRHANINGRLSRVIIIRRRARVCACLTAERTEVTPSVENIARPFFPYRRLIDKSTNGRRFSVDPGESNGDSRLADHVRDFPPATNTIAPPN